MVKLDPLDLVAILDFGIYGLSRRKGFQVEQGDFARGLDLLKYKDMVKMTLVTEAKSRKPYRNQRDWRR